MQIEPSGYTFDYHTSIVINEQSVTFLVDARKHILNVRIVAKLIKKRLKNVKFDLVFLTKHGVDDVVYIVVFLFASIVQIISIKDNQNPFIKIFSHLLNLFLFYNAHYSNNYPKFLKDIDFLYYLSLLAKSKINIV